MTDKVRFLYVLKNAQGEYLTTGGKFTPLFSKARIYKRKSDATNSSYHYTKVIVTPHKVVLVDTN